MSEKANAALTVGFLALIILIFTVADVISGDKTFSETENRILASRPELTVEAIFDGTYMEDYETYVTDQFIARDTWVELKTRADILMQKKSINGVYLGEDDYLIEQHLPGDISQEDVDKKIELLAGLVKKYGAKAMLVPTADNILTDKLPAYAQYYDQKAFLEQVEEGIGEKNLINVYDTLKEHSDEYIYYRTDHHWTTLGAYYAYMEWKDQAKRPSVVRFDPDEMETVTEEFLGTLHSKINLPWKEDTIQILPETKRRVPTLLYNYTDKTFTYYEEEYLETKNKYGYFLDDNHPLIEIKTGYTTGRKLVLLKNSYANCMVPMLANHYDEIYMIDLRYYNGRLADLVKPYMGENTDMLVLYDCIHFIEDFKYY